LPELTRSYLDVTVKTARKILALKPDADNQLSELLKFSRLEQLIEQIDFTDFSRDCEHLIAVKTEKSKDRHNYLSQPESNSAYPANAEFSVYCSIPGERDSVQIAEAKMAFCMATTGYTGAEGCEKVQGSCSIKECSLYVGNKK